MALPVCIQDSSVGLLLIFTMKQMSVAFILAVRTASGLMWIYMAAEYLRPA